MTLFLLAMLSLSFGDTRMFLSVCPPLKCTATPCLLHMFFIHSHIPCAYGITMWHFGKVFRGLFLLPFLLLLENQGYQEDFPATTGKEEETDPYA